MLNGTNYDRIRELNKRCFDEAYVEAVKTALREYYNTEQTAEEFGDRLARIQDKAFEILEN